MAQYPPGMLRDGGTFAGSPPVFRLGPISLACAGCPSLFPVRSGSEQPHADVLTGNILRSGCREVQKMKNSRKAEDAAFRAAVFTDTAITKKRSGTNPNKTNKKNKKKTSS